VVRRLLQSSLPVVSLLLTDDWLSKIRGDCDRLDTTTVYVAGVQLLESIVGYRMHQGIMAIGRIPAEPRLAQLVGMSPSPRLFIALDGLVSAENVGVVVRNCAAFSVQGILVGRDSASPYLRRAVRNSMGTIFCMPVVHVGTLSEVLADLRTTHGISVAITDAHSGNSLYASDCRGDLCIVFGHEDHGVSPDVREAAMMSIRIPMAEGVDSLNVGSASAVVLAEVSRQRAPEAI